MWYIYLRSYSTTELIKSPKYNDKIKELINKVGFMKVHFVFKEKGFVNVGNVDHITIKDFINERKTWYEEDSEKYHWLLNLEEEVNEYSKEAGDIIETLHEAGIVMLTDKRDQNTTGYSGVVGKRREEIRLNYNI